MQPCVHRSVQNASLRLSCKSTCVLVYDGHWLNRETTPAQSEPYFWLTKYSALTKVYPPCMAGSEPGGKFVDVRTCSPGSRAAQQQSSARLTLQYFACFGEDAAYASDLRHSRADHSGRWKPALHLECLRNETIEGLHCTLKHRVHSDYSSIIVSKERTVVVLDAAFVERAYVVLPSGRPRDVHSVF